MDDKRKIGTVYCVADIDQFGKISTGFKPLEEIPIFPGRAIGKVIFDLEAQVKDLKLQNARLLKIMNGRLSEIAAAVNTNKEISAQAIAAVADEITKERFL